MERLKGLEPSTSTLAIAGQGFRKCPVLPPHVPDCPPMSPSVPHREVGSARQRVRGADPDRVTVRAIPPHGSLGPACPRARRKSRVRGTIREASPALASGNLTYLTHPWPSLRKMGT